MEIVRKQQFKKYINEHMHIMADKREYELERLRAYWQAKSYVFFCYEEKIIDYDEREQTLRSIEKLYQTENLDRMSYKLMVQLCEKPEKTEQTEKREISFSVAEELKNYVSFKIKTDSKYNVEKVLDDAGGCISAEELYKELCTNFGEKNVSIAGGRVDLHKDENIFQARRYKFHSWLK